MRAVAVRAVAVGLIALAPHVVLPAQAFAAADASASSVGASSASSSASSRQASASLESAASKAADVGRKVAMSMIALGLAIAAVVLVFRRNFKHAAGVFAVGLMAVLLATPAGVAVLRSTVNALFGA